MKQLYQNKTARILCCLVVMGVLFGQGCRTQVQTDLLSRPLPARPALLGYTIQTGAFSMVSNAIRMTDALKQQGLDAFYFIHESGLFKVRVGNYSTWKKANQRAKQLLDRNIIDDYFIVAPEEYLAAKNLDSNERLLRENLVSTARKFIDYPYTWGGTSPEVGFDCSGLSLAVYHLNGFSLPRTSREQYRSGTFIQKSALKMGDLVFFKTAPGQRVSHVGVYAGDGLFIHAPGRNKTIRIDSLSNRYYKDRYAGACTYF